MTNGHINKAFAWGVIRWLNGNPLNWVKYAIYYGKYVTKLTKTKATTLAQRVKSSGVHEGKQALCPPTSNNQRLSLKLLMQKVWKAKEFNFWARDKWWVNCHDFNWALIGIYMRFKVVKRWCKLINWCWEMQRRQSTLLLQKMKR